MARSDRLLDLLQALRRHRRPVSGRALAEALGVSLRTVYRDIATLQGQGADIVGEPGLGYVLKPGFLLPPLMFSAEEIEALVLGSRFVARRGDGPLAAAAGDALAKIAAVLPAAMKAELEGSALLVGLPPTPPATIDTALLRRAIREERRLAIAYRDADGTASERVVWPFALGFFEAVLMLVAWCELRQDYRNFRVDRIAAAEMLATRYPRRRPALLKAWRAAAGIPAPD
jgi:predicted DNA-binding transcriptional regulator YafY